MPAVFTLAFRLCPPGKLDRHVRWFSRVLIIQWTLIILRTAESERHRLCYLRAENDINRFLTYLAIGEMVTAVTQN